MFIYLNYTSALGFEFIIGLLTEKGVVFEQKLWSVSMSRIFSTNEP